MRRLPMGVFSRLRFFGNDSATIELRENFYEGLT
jgi:hypothetical protein